MIFDLTERDMDNIRNWYDIKSCESSCDVEEIGTLIKLGIKDEVGHGQRFKHDCDNCLYLGSIREKFNCCKEGRMGFEKTDTDEENIEYVTRYMNDIYSATSDWVQISEYLVEYTNSGGIRCCDYFNKMDKVWLEYGYYDVYYCVATNSVVFRFGDKGEEYYSGQPDALKQCVESMRRQDTTIPLIKVYERALEIFNSAGIDEDCSDFRKK